MFFTKWFICCLIAIVSCGDIDINKNLEVNFFSDDSDGCYLDSVINTTICKDHTGKLVEPDEASEVAHNTTCTLDDGNNNIFNVSCLDGVLVFSAKEDKRLMRNKRESGFVVAGTIIGTILGGGPAGAAAGAAFGAFFCLIICEDDPPPPPNRPPMIATPPALTTSSPIIADERKITAKVAWVLPTMTDPEEGNIRVVSYPSKFENGGYYPEGSYTVFFYGADSGGLISHTHISFQVKVVRCNFTTWPENGYIDCNGSDVIYGTRCYFSCKAGYILDMHNSNLCGKNGLWTPPDRPKCQPIACVKEPIIEHGKVDCLNDAKVYGNPCWVQCENGYQANGTQTVGCDTNGSWETMPVCKDTRPPKFLDCPDDMQLYIDSANNTALVSWDEPEGDDNSNEPVTIIEVHDYKPGDRFNAGSHTIKYTIKDQEDNRGDSCIFTVHVLTLSCSPPNLLVIGGDHLKYDCPSYNFGAECTLACLSGYPKAGVDKIQCLSDNKSNPPKMDWKWKDGELAPLCKETNCSRDALNEPINGALACSQWTHGQMCQMQCGDGYDIPNIGDGLFVCGRSTGTWRPSSKVPNCDVKLDVNNMNLPSEFYYYTDKCNSSTENLNQIKENFVQALNSSMFFEECVGVPTCQSKFVDVTCGPISSRRKRDLRFNKDRRSVSELAYILQFEFVLPYKPVTGKSPDDVFAENEDRLYRMSDVVQKEVDAGHFDIYISDLRVNSDSFGPGIPSMVCPAGTFPKRESASCVGCPKGNFAKTNGRCENCPFGTYQNKTNSLACEACPPNTNTTETGAENISQCLKYCGAGEFSPNMLAPCTKCPCNSFQPNPMSVNCTRCSRNKRSPSDGATLASQCQEYDVHLSQNKAQFENNFTYNVITLFMWVYIKDNQTNSAIEFENPGSKQNFIFKLTPILSLEQSVNVVSTGQTLQKFTWTSIALVVNTMLSEVTMYIDGKVSYTNFAFNVSKYHILEKGDLIGFYGDMKISAFGVIPTNATLSDISSWAASCSPSISGTIYSMDDLADTGSVRINIPSACYAINECASSPCGSHKCINKRGGFECLCSGEYTGKQCQLPPDYCKDNSCLNNATCVNGTGNYTCNCPYGYRGDRCEKESVDGGWSAWLNWASCTRSCGGGTAIRTRRCDSPSPDAEGKECHGNSSERTSCNEEMCPECTKLRRTYGLIITCNKTSELQRCSIDCRAGLYFTNAPLPYYECGLATGYKWNHQNDDNPLGRLPSCSELEPPLQMGINFEGSFDSIQCTENNKKSVKDSIANNLSSLDCKKTGTCETSIQEPVCASSRERRSTENIMTVSIGLHASVNTNGSTFDITGLLENNTAPSKELTDFVNLTLELEKSAQILMNNSVDFFQVTVGGTQHNLTSGSSPLTYKQDISCPSGTVRFEVFCAVCPAGSYSDGRVVTMCPRGTYQDAKGQSVCKLCPSGKTTAGIGSIHVSECLVFDNSHSDNKSYIQVAVSASVAIALLIMATVGVLYACKRCNKKKTVVRNSTFDLHIPTYFNMAVKPLYESKTDGKFIMDSDI